MSDLSRFSFPHDQSTYYSDNGAPCCCQTTCVAYNIVEIRPTASPTATALVATECIGCRMRYPRAFELTLPRHDLEITAAMLSACHRNVMAVQS